VIRRKAVEKGLLDEASAQIMQDKEVYSLIMAPGFSTKDEISEISGRGVGMDVVKTQINRLNGQIDIDSQLGKGSRITIQIPLTLAILPTLMVMVGQQNFAIPLSNVVEIFDFDPKATNVIDHQLTVRLRGKSLSLYKLTDWLRAAGNNERSSSPKVVIVEAGGKSTGLLVDAVSGQEEVVIKPLGAMLYGLPGYAGATITGDGRIALILDVVGLISLRG
jgi:two-component system chemotaxis sensor kinase CheA